MIPAAGPIGKIVESDGTAVKGRVGFQLGADANALIMLHRLAFPRETEDGRIGLDEDAGRALLQWAADSKLGQDTTLIRQISARRRQVRAALRAARYEVARLRAEPEWQLAVGLGNRANAHEIGLSLHGTYGWPVIPASSLKGLAAAWAREAEADAAVVARVLGAPRLDGERNPGQGGVRFLDAIPDEARVTVAVDVLTPHVKPYYDASAAGSGKLAVPPGEYHSPVPVSFLTVSGAFAVDLYGRDSEDVDQAVRWLTDAGAELGAGAKTAAGYGYLKLTRLSDDKGTR